MSDILERIKGGFVTVNENIVYRSDREFADIK